MAATGITMGPIPNSLREVRIYNYFGDESFRFDNLCMFKAMYVFKNKSGLCTYVFENERGIRQSYAYEYVCINEADKVLECAYYADLAEYSRLCKGETSHGIGTADVNILV